MTTVTKVTPTLSNVTRPSLSTFLYIIQMTSHNKKYHKTNMHVVSCVSGDVRFSVKCILLCLRASARAAAIPV